MANNTLTAASLQAEQLIAMVDRGTVQRGRAYFAQGRAKLERLEPDRALYRVQGTHDYQVEIALDGRYVQFSCDCPVGEDGDENLCKHIVAALLDLDVQLTRPRAQDWEAVVAKAVASVPERSKTTGRVLLCFSLQKNRAQISVVPYSISAGPFSEDDFADARTLAQAIGAKTERGAAKPIRSWGDPRRFANLSERLQTVAQAAILQNRNSLYYYSGSDSGDAALLPLLSEAPVFVGTQADPLRIPVQVAPAPAQPLLNVEDRGDDGLRLRASVRLGEEILPLDTGPIDRLCDDPLWLQAGARVFSIQDPDGIFSIFVQTPLLEVPSAQKEAFLGRYLLPLAERITVQGIKIKREDVQTDPVPRLYLAEDGGALQATLRFGYGDHEVGCDLTLPEGTVQQKPEMMTLVRIIRQPAQEDHWWQELSQYGLKRGTTEDVFALWARMDPLDFLLHQIPRLTEAGYEIFGEDKLTSARINRSQPSLSFRVSSGIDWFDVQAIAQFGDLEVAVADIRRALRRRERFIKLADGTLGVIPDEWLERYRHLFGMAEETETGLRLHPGQIALLEQLEAAGDSVETDAEFLRCRARLQSFTEITPVALPAGLGGTLRPYQKAGYDWLHFLHTYGFGGCLADDMGTGKTFTTLAFLQSLVEQTDERRASLLVLPRSLIFNWEREAAKWTPGLRLLNHADAVGARDLETFDDYDLVVTTYGVLRSDVERLRRYPFRYAILDEAQAIKNPQSQTGRTARLLQAKHRLTLTGTPVENSTLELWSQYAFLNPGLLGSLEYFRQEFATPIEKRQDEAAAALLRKLVHPFLLRRTKDQVAPNLPPRTERIVYTEMEPAQRTLYEKKRDFYRAQVLGLIEKDGLGEARMKILEGLLRLRQISCHPRLAEPGTQAGSGKFEALLETLETLRAEGHKALIFSQFVQCLKLVGVELDKRQIPYAYLDGSVKDRQARVDAFQGDSNLPFFLISLKAGGVGLNLTAADYVLHIDPWWNPAVEMQATDRSHRIGQDKPVFVYKLIARDTVEEKILLLQERKRALVSQLITTESSFFKSLTRQDVEQLFE